MKLPNLEKEIDLFGKVSAVDKLTFTKHLSVMLKSGISLTEAINIIAIQNSSLHFKKILKKFSKRYPMDRNFIKLFLFLPTYLIVFIFS